MLRRYFFLAIRIIVSVVTLSFLLWRFRYQIPSLPSFEIISLFWAVFLLLFQPVLIGIRWWVLLRLYKSPSALRPLIFISWISVSANQFLPAGIGGDAVRVYLVHRIGKNLGVATASVIADRLMALIALIFLIVIFSPNLPRSFDLRIEPFLTVILITGLLAIIAGKILGKLIIRFERWPITVELIKLMQFVLKQGLFSRKAMLAVLISALIHFLSFGAFYLILLGENVFLPIGPFLAVAALLALIQSLPISIGGWGVREVASISLLGMLQVASGEALLASLVLGMCYAIASLPGFVLWSFSSFSKPLVD